MLRNVFIARVAAATFGIAFFYLAPAAANAQPQVSVNGSIVDVSPAPIVQDGRTFVPLRGVFEQLGASVVYSNGTIDATGNGRDISLQIGSTQATVNGQTQIIDVAPFIVGESTYVPLRFISEALGDSVSWDETNQIAAIDTGGGPATYYSPGTASYVDTAPPPIPDYQQPYVPEPNEIWQPGYWAWGSNGYYWVPGTWVAAPQPNYLWTPGYWQWNTYGYVWIPGYWASAVGFYGGVNYGCGYFGNGYTGGRWANGNFQYNTYVTRVNVNIVHVNVYVDRTIDVAAPSVRVSYNGGRGGLQARPTSAQLTVAKSHHIGMTVAQREHVQAAEKDRRLVSSVNHSKPPVAVVARPLRRVAPPTGFVPAKTADRVDPLANVSAVRVAPARRPAAAPHAATAPAAPTAPRVAAPAQPAPEAPRAAPPPQNPPARAVAPQQVRAPAVHAAPFVRQVAPVQAPAPAHAPPVRQAPPVHQAPPAQAPHAAPPPHPRQDGKKPPG